jgi:hypothetical protein
MTDARIGWGAELQLGTSSDAASLVELGEVRSFNLPVSEADEHEVTHLKSANKRKEFIQGMIDSGEVTATINYVPASATDLLLADARDTGTTRAVRFLIPDEAGAAIHHITTGAFVKRYSPDTVEPNTPITATVVLRITGAYSEGAVTNEDDS